MTEKTELVVVRTAFSATEAMCVVASLTGDFDARVNDEVIYPYHCYVADCSVPTMVGRKQVSMVCLVDAINGLGATADSFNLRTETVPVEQVSSGNGISPIIWFRMRILLCRITESSKIIPNYWILMSRPVALAAPAAVWIGFILTVLTTMPNLTKSYFLRVI